MLRRIGNKQGMIPELFQYFPLDSITTFIEFFMGTGAVTFAMLPYVKKIIANDNDWEVINLFLVDKDHHNELVQAILSMPEHGALMDYWKDHHEVDPIWQACRFLMLSNFGYLGRRTMRFGVCGEGLAALDKRQLLKHLRNGIHERIASPKISYMCKDFRDVLPSINFKKKNFGRPVDVKGESFLYADPPYCKTEHNYKSGFFEQDMRDLFDICIHSGIRFAISEFDTSFIRNLAQYYGLFVTIVKERRTLKSRNTEILVTNYEPVRQQLDLL